MQSQLIVIGGGVVPPRITSEIIARSRRPHGSQGHPVQVGVCTLASCCWESSIELPAKLFAAFPQVTSFGFDFLPENSTNSDYSTKRLHISSLRERADSASLLALLGGLDVLFFGGGDQRIVLETLQGTRFLALLQERFLSGALVVAGTSAGLQVQSQWALTGDFHQEQPRPDSTSEHDLRCTRIALDHAELVPGFGFLPGVILDQHFIVRGRQNRLFSAVLSRPECFGIGVDEETALCVWGDPGMPAQNCVVGKSGVFYVNAQNARIEREALSSGHSTPEKQPVLRSAVGLDCGVVFEGGALPLPLQLGPL